MSRTTASRTGAELSRSTQLIASDQVRAARKDWTANTITLTRLDLSCLPIETTFKLAMLEENKYGEVVMNTNAAEIAATHKLSATSGTLRQVAWKRHGFKTRSWLGLEINMPMTNTTRKMTVQVRADGGSGALNALAMEFASHNTIDFRKAKETLLEDCSKTIFIPQHTLKFPAVYHDRTNVSFLGLPKGTVIPLKNGGRFEVNCRANVSVELDGAATGHLHLLALDGKATTLAKQMGYSEVTMMGKPGFLVGQNLYTGLTSGRSFDTENITVPYVCPMEHYDAVFPFKVDTKHGVEGDQMAVRVPLKSSATWAETKEQLAEELDDFLFG